MSAEGRTRLRATPLGLAPATPADVLAPAPPPSADDLEQARRFDRLIKGRLIKVAVLIVALASVAGAVPGFRSVIHRAGTAQVGWLVLGLGLELASCASFVVVFRGFFAAVPSRPARRIAWAEIGMGALLPGGGGGSLALGGWLLYRRGMPFREILRRSSGLFFLTSASSVFALIGAGLLLATGISTGPADVPRAVLPILAGALVIALALGIERFGTGPAGNERSAVGDLLSGIGTATNSLRHPDRRVAGAVGYLGFDIAVLWAALRGVGYEAPIAVLILGYVIGYLANLIPIPGSIGVLEGGIAGVLVLYGAPATQAVAGALVYHAIAFWVPVGGGLFAYRSLLTERLNLLRFRQTPPNLHPVWARRAHPIGSQSPAERVIKRKEEP